MENNKKLSKGLTVAMVICMLAAFIIAVAAKMYTINPDDYPSAITESTRLQPNWSAAAPFLVLSILGLIFGLVKMIRFIKLNKNGLKGNTAAIVALICEIAFVVTALLACVSLAMFPTMKDIQEFSLEKQIDVMNGDYKCAAPIVTSVLAFVFAGVDCGLSFAKLDK